MNWSYAAIEDQICTLVIKDRNFSILVLGALKPDHFENETINLMYRLLTGYFHRYHGIPSLEEMRAMVESVKFEKFDFLMAEKIYTQQLTPSACEYIKDNIPKFIRYNNFTQMMREASVKMPVLEPDEHEEFFNEFSKKYKDIMLFSLDQDIGMSLFDVKRRYAVLKNRALNAIKPMLPGLGKVIGGYAAKELYAYVAATNVGKSIFLVLDALESIKQGKNVLYVTLEMSPELSALRIDMNISKKTSRDLIQNDYVEYLENRYKNLREQTGCGEMMLKEYPTGTASCLDIEKELELLQLYKDFRPDLLVIDYGDIMRPIGKRTGDPYRDQGQVFRELRALAIQKNLPVLTAIQTNRPTKDNSNVPIKEDRTGDSYDKMRTLDAGWSINKTFFDGEEVINKFYLYIFKNRNNAKDVKIHFTMNKDLMMVTEEQRSDRDIDISQAREVEE